MTRTKTSRMPTVSSNKAFTLFELLLVITLIAVLYGVFVHKLSRPSTSKVGSLSLTTLKPFMLELPFKKKAELICMEPCQECHIYLDGKPATEEAIKLFKDTPKVYVPDRFGQMRTIDFLPMINTDQTLDNVCFKYEVFNNKSSSYYVVESQKKYYLFDPYMNPVRVTESFSEATAFFDKSKLLPMEKRDYDH